MTRLVVLRGDVVDREFEIAHLPVRIGRSPQNEIVLADPIKSVSRNHAEIRLDGERYILVDLGSENGTWHDGNRVTEIELEPDVVVRIGAFRLKLEKDATSGTSVIDPGLPTPIAQPQPAPARPKPSLPPKPVIAAKRGTSRWEWLVWSGAAIAVVATVAVLALGLWPSRPPQQPPPAIVEVTTTTVPPSTGPAPPTVEEQLAKASELIKAGDCVTALNTQINWVLEQEPDNAEAKDLKARAEKCLNPVVMPGSKPKPPAPAREITPEDGGLEPFPNEPDTNYQTRVKAMRERYDSAVAEAAKGPSRSVITVFEGIQRDAGSSYLDVSARLEAAKEAWRATARDLFVEAQGLVDQEKWAEATARFNDAQSIDPMLPVAAELAKMAGAKVRVGEKACAEARQWINYPSTRARALENIKKAIDSLPADHPCVEQMRKYLP